jgi:transcriptional regulator with XRE-family HTH domain
MRDMNNDIRLKLVKRIKELRAKYGITQEKLSETADIDYKYLQRIEGKNPPAMKIDTLGKIAKALHVTPSELLEFELTNLSLHEKPRPARRSRVRDGRL